MNMSCLSASALHRLWIYPLGMPGAIVNCGKQAEWSDIVQAVGPMGHQIWDLIHRAEVSHDKKYFHLRPVRFSCLFRVIRESLRVRA